MPTIDDISAGVLRRLEEDTASPVFWNLPLEIRPIVLEALCEATLITGQPQVKLLSAPYTLTPSQTIQPAPAVIFSNHSVLAIIRIDINNQPLHKVSVFDLDMANKDWQNDLPAAAPNEWFPFGLGGQFGIHPQVSAPLGVTITAITNPTITSPPYTGGESINFQSEFNLGLECYGAHAARIKEGGAEAEQAMQLYETFLSVMTELSMFAIRRDSLRFSRALGVASELNEVAKK